MRQRSVKRSTLLVAAGCAVLGCGDSGPHITPAALERLGELLTTLERESAFNGVVLVADRGEVVYHAVHGSADFEAGEPLHPDAAFEVGSISKPFTAVAIHILAERGELSYEDSLTKFFPAVPYDDVTVGGLLSHTSGLFDVYDDVDMRNQFFSFYGRSDPPYTNKDYLAYLEEYQPALAAAPNERYQYSNTGYVLLALIVEQVSGQRFDEFLRRNIFLPAGMEHSVVYSFLEEPGFAALVTGYRRDSTGNLIPVTGPNAAPAFQGLTYGDDEVVTTAEDLLRFDRAIRSGILLAPESLDRLLTPPTLNDGTRGRYGQGLSITHEEELRYASHTGSTAGFLAYWKFGAEDNDHTVIVLTNVTSRGSGFRELHQSIRQILRGG